MFKNLPYTSKLKVCELFYLKTLRIPKNYLLPKKIFFSWGWITVETLSGDILINRVEVENWYNNNLKIIRKEKLISITKRETVVV